MNSMTFTSRQMRRRDLLASGALAAGLVLAGGKVFAGYAATPGISASDFLSLSMTLTARAKLDPVIAGRALAALSAEDAGFPVKALQLHDAMVQAGFRDMRRYADFIAGRAEMDAIAKKIISAWYLGYTGEPAGESDTDNARFVSYAGALMYEPTRDATVIPTFSRGRTNYWVQPPASLATD